MPRRWTASRRVAGSLGRHVLPVLLGGWGVAVSWGTPQGPAKAAICVAAALLLSQASRLPLVALAGSFVALFAVGLLEAPRPEDALLAVVVCACFGVGRFARLRHQPWAAAAVLFFLSTNVVDTEDAVGPSDVVFPVLFTAAPWLLGLTVQLAVRREQAAVRYAGDLDRLRSAEVERATAEERLRIAQELHDVVAHDMSGVSLQAQVLRRRAEAGDRVDADELRAIEQGARQAMTDLRRLLGVLRTGEDATSSLVPSEGVDRIPDLVDQASRLGQRVDLVVDGVPRELPPALSHATFRIVQEAITNARRHGAPGTTTVSLCWTAAELRVEIRNPVAPDAGAQEPGGHGVAGMQERARLFGGRAVTGRVGDHWLVDVALPAPAPTTVPPGPSS